MIYYFLNKYKKVYIYKLKLFRSIINKKKNVWGYYDDLRSSIIFNKIYCSIFKQCVKSLESTYVLYIKLQN